MKVCSTYIMNDTIVILLDISIWLVTIGLILLSINYSSLKYIFNGPSLRISPSRKTAFLYLLCIILYFLFSLIICALSPVYMAGGTPASTAEGEDIDQEDRLGDQEIRAADVVVAAATGEGRLFLIFVCTRAEFRYIRIVLGHTPQKLYYTFY